MREFRTLGSARGAACKGGPYRDRRVQPDGTVSLPEAYQCLLDALDPQEVQAAEDLQEGPRVLAARHSSASPGLRPLGVGSHVLVTRMTRAR